MEQQYTPQNNFYLWQNSDWLNNPKNQIPNDYSSWGSFTKLHDESLQNQINILNELKQILENKGFDSKEKDKEKKLAIVYQKTMQKFIDWENNIGDYSAILHEFDILNKTLDKNDFVKSLAIYGAYCLKNGIEFPINFDKDNDLENSNNVKLSISQGGYSLPSREYYFDDNFEKQRGFFKNHLLNVYNLLIKNKVKISKNFVDNVFEFEKKLAYYSMTKAQARLFDEYYTKTDLKNFYEKLDELNFVGKKLENYDKENEENKKIILSDYDKENIELFMKTMYHEMDLYFHMYNNYKLTFGELLDDAFNIMAFDGDFFCRFFKNCLDANMYEQFKSYFEYHIISSMSNYCTKELNEEFFDFYGRKLNEQQEQKTYEKRAIGVINSWLGELLGEIYVKKYFSQESKKDIELMIDNVLLIMKKSLENNTWLTQQTKEKALLKLGTFRKKIGYPNKWKNYNNLNFDENDSLFMIRNKIKSFVYETEFIAKINTLVDKEEWHMTPQTVNAYYNPQLNEIVFPAAILQPPFYQTSIDNIDFDFDKNLNFSPLVPINHGGIVAVIAHEITHGYDDQGRKFNNEGNLVDWWTEEDVKLFEEKTKLMEKQAEQYKYIDNEGNEHKMNGQLTMGENLADLGGLTLSLKALLLDSTYNNKEALSLFFRSWVNVWKCNYKEQAKIQRLVSDPHAPVDFRANLVKNIDEYYEIFNIKEGDDMWLNTEDRVKMW
jgi:putative endopeptidase